MSVRVLGEGGLGEGLGVVGLGEAKIAFFHIGSYRNK